MDRTKLFFLLIFTIYSISGNAQWQMAAGPSMTTPKCITNIDSVLFLGTSSGVFKSIDTGSTWIYVNNGIANQNVRCIHSLNSIVFVGTNDGGFGQTTDGIFRSFDYGATWSRCKNGRIHQIENIGNKLFSLEDNGLYSSKDSGATWQIENLNNGGLLYINYLASNSNKLYGASVDSSVFSRSENDTIWTPVTLNGLAVLDFKSIAANDSMICVGNVGNFFILNNHATSWIHPSNSGLFNAPVSNLLIDSNVIFAGTVNGLIRSYNGGNYWDTIYSNAIYSLLKYKGILFASTQYGLIRSNDQGSTWTTLYYTSGNAIKCLANKDTLIMASFSNLIYYSLNDGDNWDTTIVCNSQITSIVSLDSLVFAGTIGAGEGILKKNWNSGNWSPVNSGLTNTSIHVLYKAANSIYAGTLYGLFVTNNNGQSWTDISASLPDKEIFAIAVEGTRIFAGTASGVYISQNNGVSWSLAPLAIPPGSKITSITVKDSTILAGTFGYGIFKSTNHGVNWNASNSGFSGTNYFVRFINVVGTNFFVSLGSQTNSLPGILYVSIDDGTNWTLSVPSVNGINYTQVNALGYNGHNIFAASNSGYVLKKPLAQINNSCATAISAKPYVCQYDSVLFTANAGPGFTYQWLKQGAPISGATSSTYYAKQSGQYSCQFGGTCVGTSTQFTLFGKTGPSPTISTQYTIICSQNDSSLITVDSIMPSWTYQWHTPVGAIPGATQSQYYAKSFGSYTCFVADSFQCKGESNVVNIFTNPISDSSITINGSSKICRGDSVELSVYNGVGSTYQWNYNGTYIPGAEASIYFAKQEGNYNCWITNTCHVISMTAQIYYTPSPYFIPRPDSVLANVWHLEDLSTGLSSLSYSWDWGDFTNPSIGQSPSHSYAIVSNYNVCLTLTDSSGCSNTFCDSLFAQAIYVVPPLSSQTIEPVFNSNIPILNIYPIPFDTHLNVILCDKHYTNIKIYNLIGRIVYQSQFHGTIKISTLAFEKGVYFIELFGNNSFVNKKIVKQ